MDNGADADGSLLLYVCADQQLRPASFKTLNTFEQQLWQSSDPRVESRAKLIAQRMILPYLTQTVPGANEHAIEIIDLGADSGLLTARICQILKDTLPPMRSHVQRHADSGENVFLPVRTFNQQCLLTADGHSIVARMLDERSLLAIQDMDLRPQDIRLHCEQQELSHIAVLNVGKGLGLKSDYCYLVLHQDDPALATLKGERVW